MSLAYRKPCQQHHCNRMSRNTFLHSIRRNSIFQRPDCQAVISHHIFIEEAQIRLRSTRSTVLQGKFSQPDVQFLSSAIEPFNTVVHS